MPRLAHAPLLMAALLPAGCVAAVDNGDGTPCPCVEGFECVLGTCWGADALVKPAVATPRLDHPRAVEWIIEYPMMGTVGQSTGSFVNVLTGSNRCEVSTVDHQPGTATFEAVAPDGVGLRFDRVYCHTTPNDAPTYEGAAGEGYTLSLVYLLPEGRVDTYLMTSIMAEITSARMIPMYNSSANPEFLPVAGFDQTAGRHHLILVVDGTTATVFQDGERVGAVTLKTTGSPIDMVGTWLRFPTYESEGDVVIIGARVWDRPLSSAEVGAEFVRPWELISP